MGNGGALMDEAMESPERPPVFPILSRICIALLLAAFSSLLAGYRFGSFGAPETREFLEAHLVVTAMLLAAPDARFSDRFSGAARIGLVIVLMFVAFASAALGVSNFILAGKAVIKVEAARLWIAALAAPGALGLWKVFWHIASQQEVNQKNETAVIAPSPARDDDYAEAEAAAEQTLPAPRATLQAYMRAAVLYSVLYTGVIAVVIIAFSYHRYANAALFNDWFAGWQSIGKAFVTALIAGAPTLIALAIVLLLLIGGQGIFKAIGQAIDLAAHPDADRTLTPEEIALIRDVWLKLEHFLLARRGNSRVVAIYWLVIILFFVVLGLGFLFALGDDGIGAFLFRPGRTAGLEWFIYRDGLGAADILACFTLMLVYSTLVMAVGLVWPAFAIHSDLKSKSRTAPKYDVRTALRQAVARGVRLHLTENVDEFDPRSFLIRGWRSMTKWVAGATALLAAVNAGFWYLDRMDYLLITEDYIVYTDYWTSTTHKVGYNSIDKIKTACGRDKDDYLWIRYGFSLDNDRVIEVASFSNPREFRRLGADIANWSKADATARAVGAIVDSSGFMNECEAGLEDLVGLSLADQAMALLTE